MKRYLVFFGLKYYPYGGMDDFLGDFDTMEECRNAIDERIKKGYWEYENTREHIEYEWRNSWAHIYDSQTWKKVWEKRS